MSGDKITFSGTFENSIINVKSTLTQVSQSVGGLRQASSEDKDELKTLVDKLGAALEGAAPSKPEEAEAVAKSAKTLVDMAKEEKPNRTLLQIAGEGLKQAAQTVADVAPSVITLVSRIAEIVSAITV